MIMSDDIAREVIRQRTVEREVRQPVGQRARGARTARVLRDLADRLDSQR